LLRDGADLQAALVIQTINPADENRRVFSHEKLTATRDDLRSHGRTRADPYHPKPLHDLID
jgi:hypothetical protein